MIAAFVTAACSGTDAGLSDGDSVGLPVSGIISDQERSESAVPRNDPVSGPSSTSSTTTTTTVAASTTTTGVDPHAPPAWLGTIALPLRADGHGEVRSTPAELEVRQIRTRDVLPGPAGPDFEASIGPVPDAVLARSTWTEDCPVGVDELRYVTVSHVGFDGAFHTGELLVNVQVAEDLVDVFRRLHEARFPIEEMQILSTEAMEAPPTGDRNNTSSFECRTAVGSGSFSQHAYGLALDLNPFQNPYVKGDLVLPELSSAYLDRSRDAPGMIHPDGPAVAAFDGIGWAWGGNWNSLKDYHHFSLNGR